MSNSIFKTKYPLLAFVLPVFALVVLTYSFSTAFSGFSTVITSLLLLLVAFFTVFATSPIFEFYDDYFEVKYPFLSFLSPYKSKRYFYRDINDIKYYQVFYFPDYIRITQKNNKNSIIYMSFRFLSSESKKIKDIFTEKEVNFSHQRYGKKK